MDKQTRNIVQKATKDTRKLLETDFAQQFKDLFDTPTGSPGPPVPKLQIPETEL